ncbi:MAG TPA: hypothetical protein VIT38_17565 [Allosphingosinicella sp.]|jgi:hypothetical protein
MLELMILLGTSLTAAPAPVTPLAASPDPTARTMPQSEVRTCRAEPITGSRLGAARACHTEAEWEELRRQSIQTVNRIQNNRPWNSNACPNSLKPGC